jgi:hypothetical protein
VSGGGRRKPGGNGETKSGRKRVGVERERKNAEEKERKTKVCTERV